MPTQNSNPAIQDEPADTVISRSGSVVARSIRRVGLVAAASGLIVAAGFASEYALVAHFIVGSPTYDTMPGILIYVAAVIALAVLIGVVGAEIEGGSQNRGLAGWLIGVSAAGALFFGLLSTLGAQFWAGSRNSDQAETVVAGLLYFVSFAGPAIASLVAAIVIFGHGSRLPTAWLPSLLVLAVVAVSVLVLVVVGL